MTTILLLGGGGQIGWELQRSLSLLGTISAPDRTRVDLCTPESVRACVRTLRPQLIVNAAGWTAVDAAETAPGAAHAANAEGPRVLAREAQACGAWLVHYSTDYVFDGDKTRPYQEQDRTNPLSVYGASKLAGEEHVRAECTQHLILRTSWVYSGRGKNFMTSILRLARERDHLRVVSDQFGAPTHAALVADATALALHHILHRPAAEELAGTYHLAAEGMTNWHGYARHLIRRARACGLDLRATEEAVEAVTAAAYGAAACRPHNSRLDTTKFQRCFGLTLPDWRTALDREIMALTERSGL